MTNKRDFNLGDCVTVCGADSHYEGYTGEVVEVYELISDIYNYLVNFEDDVSCWYFANELKLVDRISYEKSASPEQNALEFLLKQDDTKSAIGSESLCRKKTIRTHVRRSSF